jgi:hypothetical protein
VGVMFQNHLFQEQECTLVVDSLAKLNLSDPLMRRPLLFAIIALQIGDYEFNDEALLQKCVIFHFLLNVDPDFNATGMRLGPDETCIEKLDALKASDGFETYLQ